MPHLQSVRPALAVLVLGALLGALMMFAVRNTTHSAAGSPTIVNSTADTTVDDGSCTLREAINSANTNTSSGPSNGECAGPDYHTINFNIQTGDPGYGSSVWTIKPSTALPVVTSPVIIDGYSQPGAAANSNHSLADGTNATLKIVLDGQGVGGIGLEVTGGNSTVSGLVIHGWNFRGIYLTTNGSNRIVGNFIGTNADGTAAVTNNNGMEISSNGNTIGGTAPADANIISGVPTPNTGIFINAVADTLIQGNFIGTDATATQSIPTGSGVGVYNGSSNTHVVGNVLSGNSTTGVAVHGPNNFVQGNLIGTAGDGHTPLPNLRYGVLLGGGVSNTLVGGPNPGDGNVIAFNGQPNAGYGVFVYSTGNTIEGNSIYSTNGGLGIDFDGDKLTLPNDTGDADGGTNNGQNHPVITSAHASSVHVEGTFESLVLKTFRIEVFSNDACDPSNFGEGQQFLGHTDVTTDNDGIISWYFDSNSNLTMPTFITATATNIETGDTSEFSNCVRLLPSVTPTPTPSPTPSPTPTPSTTPIGHPTLTSTPTPSAEPTGPLVGDGDCDGDVDFADVTAILRQVTNLPGPTSCAAPATGPSNSSDTDCDNAVTPLDALNVLLHLANLPELPLPTACPVVGDQF